MRKITFFKTLLVAAGLLVGSSAWADDITSLPYSIALSTASGKGAFDNGTISTGTKLAGGVLNVNNTTATATFSIGDDNAPYTLASNEEVTVSFVAYHGWLGNAQGETVKLLNNDGKTLVSYTYDLSCSTGGAVKDVTFGDAVAPGFTANSDVVRSWCNSAGKSANGLTNNPYNVGATHNTSITMKVRGNGKVSITFVNDHNKTNKTYTTTLSTEDFAMNLKKFQIVSSSNNGDRTICISDLSITTALLATQCTYTKRWVDGEGNELKTEDGEADAGSTVAIGDTYFKIGDVKWKCASIANNTLSANGQVVTVTCAEAPKYSYSVKTSFGTVLKEGTDYEAEGITYYWPQVQEKDGTLYTAPAVKSQYKDTFTLDEDKTITVTYTAGITGIAFLAEGEDLFTVGTGSSADIRLSMGKGGYASTETNVTTISAVGTYRLVMVNRCSGTKTNVHTFKAGGEVILIANGNGYNQEYSSSEFVVAEPTTITMQGGNASDLVDWVYIVKTGDLSRTATIGATGYTTFASSFALNLSELPAGLEAYYIKSDGVQDGYVTLTAAAGNVEAGTGLLLKGTASTPYEISLAASGSALDGNLLKGVTAATDVDAAANKYVLVNNDGTAEFQSLKTNGASIPAGKAYLEVPVTTPDPTANLRIIFDDEATAINALNAAKAESDVLYNVAGQRVSDSYKGIVIKNGKKYLNK